MKKSVQSTIVLVAICAVMAVLLALTNAVTAPIIKINQDTPAFPIALTPVHHSYKKPGVRTLGFLPWELALPLNHIAPLFAHL